MKKINPILQVRYEGIGYKGIRIQPYFPIPLFLFIFIGINYFKSPKVIRLKINGFDVFIKAIRLLTMM